jgi:hypothetical protein
VENSSDSYRGFTARRTPRYRSPRVVRAVWSAAIVLAVVGLKSGCGSDPGGAAPTVKDPPPLAPDQTTEALIKSKAGSAPGRAQRR